MKQNGKNIFVFVVCGERAHIDTLHFSLRALMRFSKKEILVVTDSARNEIPVKHNSIIDIRTPVHLNHHQASIFLKTGLYQFLPPDNNYCYLDSDVVALSNKVDEVFEHFVSPITFCADHCCINAFSPSAINCNCRNAFDHDNQRIEHYSDEFNDNVLPVINYIDKCREEINELVIQSKKAKWNYALRTLFYCIPTTFYVLNARYKMNKKTGRWYDDKGTLLWYPHKDNILYTEEKTGFRFNRKTKEWFRNNGESLGKLGCNHLVELINKKFGVAISLVNWRHWNGGVFLFNAMSKSFMQKWHYDTLEIFSDSNWKTRDQGTLAANTWRFGLEHNATLPVEFNFIADYNKSSLKYAGNFNFVTGKSNKVVRPYFIHIYHHWGDGQWSLWRDVREHILGAHVE